VAWTRWQPAFCRFCDVFRRIRANCAIIPDSNPPASLALNLPWIFRIEAFVLVPLAIYIIWMLVESVFRQQPILKLGLGPLQIERAKTELVRSGLALEEARQAVPITAVDQTAYQVAMNRFQESIGALDEITGSRGR